ncbi:hypothetical protein PR202_ga10476 [Eleusine coracana subsp. coracana]|uniref:Uncharacterized protein n=1 Tax=Eleusine coracana subsp. coracana TaxID=191504 RepID=A0AAV5C6V2_ELECO|nr:hypothetical protein PR202_ga10476 [Eleusine coracana subsp. coracana]
MANYLSICLEPTDRIWLNSLLEKSVTSWGHFNRKLIESFQASCNQPGTHFDLNVPDQQIIAAFQGGMQSDDLVCKIGRRNPDLQLIARECFEIADKFALGKSALYDISGKGKEKRSNKRESSKKDKKRKNDNMIATVDRSKKNPRMNQQTMDDLLSGSCLWHPKGNHKAKDCYHLKGFMTATLKVAKDPPRQNGKNKASDDGDKDEEREF